ncbi:20694_t:CDS:2, partial [Gigaspora margarita]
SLPCSDSHQKILDCDRLHEEPSSIQDYQLYQVQTLLKNDSIMSGNSSRTLIASDDGNSDPPSWDILFNKFFMIIQHSLIDVENNYLKLENEFKTQYKDSKKQNELIVEELKRQNESIEQLKMIREESKKQNELIVEELKRQNELLKILIGAVGESKKQNNPIALLKRLINEELKPQNEELKIQNEELKEQNKLKKQNKELEKRNKELKELKEHNKELETKVKESKERNEKLEIENKELKSK